MRVAQLSPYVDPLGRAPEALLDAWVGLTTPAEAAASAGVEVVVVQPADRDAVVERNDVPYMFVRERPASGLRRRLGFWALPVPRRSLDAVAGLAPDVVHAQGLAFPRVLKALRRRLGDVAILVQDHADAPPPAWRRWVHRWGLARADGAAFTAREQAEPFVEAGVLDRDTPVFEVVEASTRFEPGDRESARASTGLHGDPCLLWLGHLDANKDPLTVLDAIAEAAAELPDLALWCAYRSAPLLDTVKARLDEDTSLRDRVHLLGARPHREVELLLRAADFLVQGSRREGSGYAVIEALACGATPVVTNIPAFRALTDGGAVGALAPVADASAMARALVELARADRTALRSRARLHFETRLSVRAIGAQLHTAYDGVLAARASEAGAGATRPPPDGSR